MDPNPGAAPPPASAASAAPAAPRRRRRNRLLWVVLGLAVAIGAGAAGGLVWLWQSTEGLAAIVKVADRLLPARLEVRQPSGSLASGFAFDELVYETADLTVRVERLQATLESFRLGLASTDLRFEFDELLAERLVVFVRPSTTPSSGPPASIASPVTVTARRLAIGAFDYRTQPEPGMPLLQLRAIDTQAAIGPDGYRFTDGRLAWGPAKSPLQARLSAALGGARPFALDSRGELSGSLQDRPLRAAFTTRGSLADLLLEAEITRDPGQPGEKPQAEQPRGRIALRLASFEAPALREMVADLEQFDPSAWVEGAPRALLTVHAELKPRPGPQFSVSGPIEISNAAPGTLDRGRIPARSLRAQVEATAERLRLDDVAAELTRGRVRGSFEIGVAQLDAWRARIAFNGVDPAALHGALRPFALDGEATFAHEAGDTSVVGQARNRDGLPLQADVDLRASSTRVQVGTAQLRLGTGHAMVAGEVQLTGSRAVRLAGSVVELDPALLVSGLNARLTGTFNANGVLAPQPAGSIAFGLAESQIYGRPVVGRGALTLGADQMLDVDAMLSVRGATLTARGGLGGTGRTLALELVVPQLRDLGLQVAGRLTANARLSGAWTAPAVDAQIEAGTLIRGSHRVDEFQAVATYSGGTDGTLALQASLANHRLQGNPTLSLQTATLRADGTLSDHRIELRANNEEAQALALELVGGWRQHEPKAAPEWRGELRTANAGKPLDMRLLAPLPIRTDFGRWAIGPLDLSLAGARIEQARVDLDRGVFSTSGRFSDFRPSELRGGSALSSPLTRGAQPHVPTTLRGNWQLRLGEQADGGLLIERSGGDILAGTTAMGITDLRLSAELRASRLQAEARLLGAAAGRAEARLAAEVERGSNGWRLAQQRPLAATLDVDMPSLAWVNSLMSQAVRANVRTGGSLKGTLKIDGTPADPIAKGEFAGTALRLAWIDQGIRLENGRLAARVDGDRIVLDELRFSGTPQVQPADRRAAQALAREKHAEDGFLAMNGQLQLRDLSGVLQVQAVRVPFLQRPDRWVVATGGANIVFDQKRVQLNGAVAANAGFVDISRSNLPSLSSDVQVIRASDPVSASREAPIGLNFDIGIDLGEAFYMRGAGLDTQVEGQMRLRAEGRGAIRATGTLQARDGVFVGFGQRLEIERGRVNFQGPLDNPGLDVLALRRGLPVDVGVAVTRTAQSPLVKLYSAEPMTEPEILSWLVLGRAASDSDGGQDRVALATAAASILAGGGEGVGSQFARRFGIDELSLRTGEMASAGSLLPRTSVAGNVRGSSSTATEEIVTVGKRLSDNITLSFEQATTGAESLVQIVYRLTKQVSILARAGTENAVNLVYTFTFD
jgi:translocation and assembly module TamB